MNLQEYLRLLRRFGLLIAAFVLVGVIGGSVATALTPPSYEATAKSYVSTGTATSLSDLSQGNSFAQQAMKTYASIATTPYVLDGVIKELGLRETAADLAESVSVTTPVDETILEVAVSDPSPVRAARIANTVAGQLENAAVSLTPDTTGITTSVRITQLQPAVAPSSPASPSLKLNVLIGALLGLIFGLVLTALIDTLDTRVRHPRDLRRMSSGPLLAAIAWDSASARAPLVMRRSGAERMAEAYRTLRTNIQADAPGDRGRAFTVTSSVPGEGKTTTALNLGVALADAYQSVLLVDADLRQPQIAERTGLEAAIGLNEVLNGTVQLNDALQRWEAGGLTVLTSGGRPRNPSEMLQSKVGVRLLEELVARFDVVIIDSPPLLEVSDAAILARRTEGALLVCGGGRVRRPQVKGAIAALDQVGAEVSGLILTMERRRKTAPSAYQQFEDASTVSGEVVRESRPTESVAVR